MPSANPVRNNLATILSGLGLLALVIVGCSTVVPAPVQVSAWSWDGTNQNSGILLLTSNVVGRTTLFTGAVITPHAKARYTRLMGDFGQHWGLTNVEEGLTPLQDGTFWLDAQHLFYFQKANTWALSGKAPEK